MKKTMEERVLKTVIKATNFGKRDSGISTSLCPLLFHQPKRPQKKKVN